MGLWVPEIIFKAFDPVCLWKCLQRKSLELAAQLIWTHSPLATAFAIPFDPRRRSEVS